MPILGAFNLFFFSDKPGANFEYSHSWVKLRHLAAMSRNVNQPQTSSFSPFFSAADLNLVPTAAPNNQIRLCARTPRRLAAVSPSPHTART